MQQNSRRKLITGAVAAVAAGSTAKAQVKPEKKIYRTGPKPATPPAYSPAVSYGNLLFLSGFVYRQTGDIKTQTEAVLNDIRTQLEAAGSSMSKVLKCTVLLADIKDFAGMNEVYTGKFGDEPPARTTAAVAGLPANSLIEIDVVAYV